MKNKNIFWSLLAALAIPASGLFTSCENADADLISNRVYISEAASSPAVKVAIEQEGAKVAMTIRMADVIPDQDVRVKLKIDPAALEVYNQTYKTNYEVLPEEYFAFESDECVIKAGEVMATQSIINVKSFTTGGKNYALPVVIASVDGPIDMTNTSSKLVFILDKPLIVKTPIFTGSNDQGVVAGPFKDNVPEKWKFNTLNWTLEGWVRMSQMTTNNQALFTSGSGDHEIYIRFGDVNKYTLPDRMNYLQIKTLGSQTETGPIFLRNKWHHFCLTYDGSSCKIYVNGNLETGFTPPLSSRRHSSFRRHDHDW